MNNKICLTIKCIECHESQNIFVEAKDFEEYQSGRGYIQDIFSYLTAAEREMLISRICGKCWDKLFKEEE